MTHIYLSDIPCSWHTRCRENKLHLIYCACFWIGIAREFGAGTKSRPDGLITQLFHQNKPWYTILCYLQLCLESSFWMKLPLCLMSWISVQSFCCVCLLASRMNAGAVSCCVFIQLYTSFASCELVKTPTWHGWHVLSVTVMFDAFFLIHTFTRW